MADDDFSTPDSMQGLPLRQGVNPNATTDPGLMGEPPASQAFPPLQEYEPGQYSPAIPIPTDPYIFPRRGTQPVSEIGVIPWWIVPGIISGAAVWAFGLNKLAEQVPLPPTPNPPAPIFPLGEMFGNPAFQPAAPFPGLPEAGDGA